MVQCARFRFRGFCSTSVHFIASVKGPDIFPTVFIASLQTFEMFFKICFQVHAVFTEAFAIFTTARIVVTTFFTTLLKACSIID